MLEPCVSLTAVESCSLFGDLLLERVLESGPLRRRKFAVVAAREAASSRQRMVERCWQSKFVDVRLNEILIVSPFAA